MSETKSVWVIERGEYSDYSVVGVFSSRENAERVAQRINASEYAYSLAEVAEWQLNPGVDALNSGLSRFRVLMLRDGTTEDVRRDDDPWSGFSLASTFHLWERSEAPAYVGENIGDVLAADVWAEDEQHAVKIANERRVQMIASGEWR